MNASPFGSLSVARTPEIRRIAALPRRTWTDEAAARLADMLTKELKTPGGTQRLRPVQAIALFEAMETGGLFGPIRVGGGKTLCTLCLPQVLEAKRPVLLMPASLVSKTWRERDVLKEHWRLPTNVQIISYESLSLVQSAQKLEYIRPDLIVADECHYLKARKAGRTRRVVRYMHEHPETRFAGVSGTVMRGSIVDFAHLLRFALKDRAPIPVTEDEVATWADSLDEKVNPLARRKPSAIFDLGARPPGFDEITAARHVFQTRLLETRGVVASAKGDGVVCSIRVQALEYTLSPVTEEHFRTLRAAWETPCGKAFSEATELRMYARELGLGFSYSWVPREKTGEWDALVSKNALGLNGHQRAFLAQNRPPEEWLGARKAWCSFVRNQISASKRYDTMLQIANACRAGDLNAETLDTWQEIQGSYEPATRPIFYETTALETCLSWAKENVGIIWVEHKAFGDALSRLASVPYFGPGGLDASGNSIAAATGKQTVIASISACGQGFNLQAFSKNLITSCPSGAATIEQVLGRTHRDGQEADEVVVDILLGCREQYEAFDRALEGAKAAEALLGHSQKLLLADLCMPDLVGRRGPLWH